MGSIRWKNRRFAAITAVFALSLGILCAQKNQAAVELEGAIAREQVSGDLHAAIAAYQKIANENSAPRNIQAKALLHLAACYDKLGQEQSRSIYERIVRDYADQPSAEQARAHLVALNQRNRLSPPLPITQHKIELPFENVSPGDTDGRRVVYFDQKKRALVYSDIVSGKHRTIITTNGNDELGYSTSRDFAKVFLDFYSPQKPRLAVINTDGSGFHDIPDLGIVVGCWMWSWDSRYLLLCGQSTDGVSHLLTVRVSDGQRRELVALKSDLVTAAAFSPDGRSVAYKVGSRIPGQPCHISIMPAGAGLSQQVYEESPFGGDKTADSLRLLDWTADGRFLAISSRRTGVGALYLLPIENGRAIGTPIFVQHGEIETAVTTLSGGLVYHSPQPESFWPVYVTRLDAEGRPGDWKQLNAPPGGEDFPAPSWSPDSNHVAYVQSKGESANLVRSLHVYDLSAGADREIYSNANYVPCVWGAQQTKLFCSSVGPAPFAFRDTQIVSMSIQSGDSLGLHTFPDPSFNYRVRYTDEDDQAIYICKSDASKWTMLRLELNSHKMTEVESGQNSELYPTSRDQKWLVRKNEQAVEIRPRAGGDWKYLFSLSKDFDVLTGWVALTPDGKWIIFRDLASDKKEQLFRISTEGGIRQILGEVPVGGRSGSMQVSPDGRKLLLTSAEILHQYLWMLENFVPPVPKR